MKMKRNEIHLPDEVIHNRVDLSKRMKLAGLSEPLGSVALKHIEAIYQKKHDEALAPSVLIQAQKLDHDAKAKLFREEHKKLVAATKAATQKPAKATGGDNFNGGGEALKPASTDANDALECAIDPQSKISVTPPCVGSTGESAQPPPSSNEAIGVPPSPGAVTTAKGEPSPGTTPPEAPVPTTSTQNNEASIPVAAEAQAGTVDLKTDSALQNTQNNDESSEGFSDGPPNSSANPGGSVQSDSALVSATSTDQGPNSVGAQPRGDAAPPAQSESGIGASSDSKPLTP